MMSTTGNNRGFTLIEVMVATAVLALSTAWISGSFFIALDSHNYCASYLSVVAWANDKIWEAQDALHRRGPAAALEGSGSFSQNRKNFIWTLAYTPLGDSSLYRIDLELFWKEHSRNGRLQRSAYAVYEPPQ